MADRTGIAWTRSTFNPWIGCTEVSPGCDACYARELDKRHRYGGATHWGAGVERYVTSLDTWLKPERWNALAEKEKVSGKIEDGSDWHTPGFWPVFPSMCDPFDKEVPGDLRATFWQLIYDNQNLAWLLLTKRIGNAAKMLPWRHGEEPWPNVWIGASVVNREEAARDLLKLYATRASRRFVSYEPALEEVNFDQYLEQWRCRECGKFGNRHTLATRKGSLECPRCLHKHAACGLLEWCGVDQLIIGGESRQGKHQPRPFIIGWARAALLACRNSAGTAFFMKQFGGFATNREGVRHPFKDRAGADPAEWPQDLQVQEFPT